VSARLDAADGGLRIGRADHFVPYPGQTQHEASLKAQLEFLDEILEGKKPAGQ
jgi:hypothetical protein